MLDHGIPHAVHAFVERSFPSSVLNDVMKLAEQHGEPGFDPSAKAGLRTVTRAQYG
jgi:hypothetical protein